MSWPLSAAHPIVVVVGTRPEVIKLAPVVLALRHRGLPTVVVSTGQHREMLRQSLAAFDLAADRDLDVMLPDQSLATLSARLLEGIDRQLAELEPSWLVVQGDTTTVAIASLAAFYRRIGVAHVEAGLRTHHRYDPFPEEMNRTLVGHLAELHLAPTATARANLLAQGVAAAAIHVVGNTVVDAVQQVAAGVRDRSFASLGLPPELADGRRLLLVTGHRREKLGPAFRDFCRGLLAIAEEFAGGLRLVYPVHLNPQVRSVVHEMMSGAPDVLLLEPLSYPSFVKLMTAATLIVTDSGGVQEEATTLGVPLLVCRDTSERPEALAAGVAELVGTDPERIASAARRLLTDEAFRLSRAVASDVFGDGRAAARIAALLAGDGAAPEGAPGSGDA